MLNEGRYGSISEMARAEKIERGYMGKVLQLTLLAPKLVEAILEGRQVGELTLPSVVGRVAGCVGRAAAVAQITAIAQCASAALCRRLCAKSGS